MNFVPFANIQQTIKKEELGVLTVPREGLVPCPSRIASPYTACAGVPHQVAQEVSKSIQGTLHGLYERWGGKASAFNAELVRTLAHRITRGSGSHGISYTAKAVNFSAKGAQKWFVHKHNHLSNLAQRFLLLSCVRCLEMFDSGKLYIQKMV